MGPLRELRVTRNQAVATLLLFLLMATSGAVWQFGPYGLYGGAFVGLVTLGFIHIDSDKKKGGDGG